MVLKNDPRKVLELFNKPVDMDEDEFLDTIDTKVRYIFVFKGKCVSLWSLDCFRLVGFGRNLSDGRTCVHVPFDKSEIESKILNIDITIFSTVNL
jgi:hypothetical protein